MHIVKSLPQLRATTCAYEQEVNLLKGKNLIPLTIHFQLPLRKPQLMMFGARRALL